MKGAMKDGGKMPMKPAGGMGMHKMPNGKMMSDAEMARMHEEYGGRAKSGKPAPKKR